MSSPVLILTGASRGLGLAIAQRLLSAHNARLVTLQRTITPDLTKLADKYPEQLVNVSGDVSKPEDNTKAVRTAIDKFGQLNGLVLNAGSLNPMGESSSFVCIEGVTWRPPVASVCLFERRGAQKH